MADPLDNPLQSKLTPGQLEVVLGGLEGLATLGSSAARVLELCSQLQAPEAQSRPARQALDEAVSADVALVAGVLRLRSRREECDLEQAVGGLQPVELVSLVLSGGTCCADLPLCRADFWRHCLAVAAGTELISQRLALDVKPSTAWACGLLHDLGKLAMSQCMPKSYQRAYDAAKQARGDIAAFERDIIGVDHPAVGHQLARLWRLPEIVQQCIWLHHQPPAFLPRSLIDRRLVAAVGLADALARQQEIGCSGNFQAVGNVADRAAELKLDVSLIDAICADMRRRVERCEQMLGLERSDSDQRYVQALTSLTKSLAAGAPQRAQPAAAAHARALELLGRCGEQLSGDASLCDVLAAIAGVWARAIELALDPDHPLVAYAVSEDARDVPACRLDDKTAWRTLTRAADYRAAMEPDPHAATAIGQLLAAPEELDDWLDAGQAHHWPLVCAGQWVGGFITPRGAAAAADMPPLRTALALVLAFVQGRSQAGLLGEQLAAAGRALAEAQDALAENKSLAAVGEMAAGAAHEINNPLAVISGRAQLMASKAATDADKKIWQTLSAQAQVISDIVTQLMEFASPPPPRPQAASPAELLQRAKDAFAASGHIQAASSTVDISIGQDVPEVQADPAQIEQVLVELLGNAATAGAPSPRMELSAVAAGAKVLLTVKDFGPGMDAATLAKAFAPFFSLQKAGRRRGLGLPRARRLLEINGGRIWLQSRVGAGTTAFVELPAAEQGDS